MVFWPSPNRRPSSASLSKPEYLPPTDVQEAITRLIADHVGLRTDELATAVCKILGFRTTPPGIRRIVERELENLQSTEVVTAQEGRLFQGKQNVRLAN